MTRDEAARRFAELIGMAYIPETAYIERGVEGHSPARLCPADLSRLGFAIPAYNAPRHAQLAFVGRIADAVGADWLLRVDQQRPRGPWAVRLLETPYTSVSAICEREADDLVNAALLAGVEALEAKR